MLEPYRLAREARALNLVPVLEVVPPLDSRTEVTDTLLRPYRWICFIEMKLRLSSDRKGRTVRGTGILVSPRHVLTSAHMFDTRDVTHRTITVTPARKGDAKPFGEAKVILRRSSPHYRSGQGGARFDFALLTLDKRIGDTKAGQPPQRLGYWGETSASSLAPQSVSAVHDKDVEVAGYPCDKPIGTMWAATGIAQIAAREPRRIDHTADTKPSMSGGPLFLRTASTTILVGLHSRPGVYEIDASNVQTLKNNFATRLTADMVKQVRDWIAKDDP
jgi:V8-like Glu-specific endopeptidase